MTKQRTGTAPQIPGNELVEELNTDAPVPDGEVPAEPTEVEKDTEALIMPKFTSNLPDADDIDPSKIKRAVLTKQGWICPLEIQ